MTINETITAANERTVELVTAMQQNILEATKTHIAAVAGSAKEQPTWTAPEPIDAPDPAELIEETFKFQSRLLEVNRSFALALTDVLGQAIPKTDANPKSDS